MASFIRVLVFPYFSLSLRNVGIRSREIFLRDNHLQTVKYDDRKKCGNSVSHSSSLFFRRRVVFLHTVENSLFARKRTIARYYHQLLSAIVRRFDKRSAIFEVTLLEILASTEDRLRVW